MFDFMKSVNKDVGFILCHGAGRGTEVEILKAQFPSAKVVGTDLAEWSSDCIVWDFNKPNPEWEGKVDLLYTNSLDHSPNPPETLKVWASQLSPNGYFISQWNLRHAWLLNLDKIYRGGDCFATHLDEYIQAVDAVMRVDKLLFIPKKKRGGFRVLVAAGRRS